MFCAALHGQVWSAQHSVRGQTSLQTGRYNPHRSYHQFATACGSQVVAWDSRTGEQSWSLHTASQAAVRSIDFNPNKQYFLAAGGEDGSWRGCGTPL